MLLFYTFFEKNQAFFFIIHILLTILLFAKGDKVLKSTICV